MKAVRKAPSYTINGLKTGLNAKYLKLAVEAWQEVVTICKEEGEGSFNDDDELGQQDRERGIVSNTTFR